MLITLSVQFCVLRDGRDVARQWRLVTLHIPCISHFVMLLFSDDIVRFKIEVGVDEK